MDHMRLSQSMREKSMNVRGEAPEARICTHKAMDINKQQFPFPVGCVCRGNE